MSSRIVPCAFARLEAELISLYEPPLRAAATLAMMRQVFREIRVLPDLVRTADLTPPTIAAWIKSRPGRSSARTETLLRCLRVVCNYAVARKWLDVSPFAIRPLRAWLRPDAVPSRNRGKVYRRSQAEIATLLRLLDAEAGASWQSRRLQALVYCYTYTAFRKQEALHLLARNIDFAAGTITIEPLPDWTPKTVRSSRTVPMAAALADVLRPWVQMCGSDWLFPGTRLVGPWTGGGPRYCAFDQIVAASTRAGLGRVSPLYFRKWFGTNAKSIGLGPLEVQSFLGHSNPDTQRAYDEERVESMRPAVRKLELFYGAQA